MPIIDHQDARELDSHLQRFFDSPPSERPHRLRQLFTEKFDFNPASGKVSLANAPKNVALPPDADRIASIEGINVVYVPLQLPGTARVRKAEAVAASRIVAGQLGDDMLLLMINEQGNGVSQLHVVLPTLSGSAPALRRMVIERYLPRRTALQQLSNIYHHWQRRKDLRLALQEAFNVEAVTRAFFEQYRCVFEQVQGRVKGFPETDDGHEDRKLFVQTLFNRLMFIYFLSRKGWLKFKGNPDYLASLWKDYREDKDARNFYEERLKLLFFAGLNNPRSADLLNDNPTLHALIGDVPFLNGGLFTREEQDERSGITVPDEGISAILHDLFDRYNFTVTESTPLDQEVAVDPEMLGKVFEELVTGRHETGSYYTPRPVVSFMCREALKGYLQGALVDLTAEAVQRFVDQHDVSGLNLASAEKVRKALEQIKIVDPACGSGAYLLGMMHELVELETALYSEKLVIDPTSLYDLKLRVIEENVYGADIDQFAVNIAMLRLWLSLAIDYESFPPPPLPNLDFKIVCGDSLLGPDPNPDTYGTLFRHRVHDLASRLADLKGRHMKSTSQEKDNLHSEIESLQDELREALADAAAVEGAVDWRIVFAEVFDQNGGFDVTIANPPYVNVFKIDDRRPGYRELLKLQFATATGRFDLYVPFMERGMELTAPGGMFVFITPNKFLSAEYAAGIRRYFESKCTLRSITDLSRVPVFSAAVYPVITIAQRKYTPPDSVTIDILAADSTESAAIHALHTAPLTLGISLDSWSPLLDPGAPALLPLLLAETHIEDLAEVSPASWVNEAYDMCNAIRDDGQTLAESYPNRFVPFIVSGNIRPHYHTWHEHRVHYLKKTYTKPVLDLENETLSAQRRSQITSPKVIVSGMAKRPVCVWDPNGIAAGVSTIYVLPRAGTSGAYLAGVLNSALSAKVYRAIYGALSLAGGFMRFGAPQIKRMPLPKASPAEQKQVANLVEAMMATSNPEDKRRTQAKIEALVEELFGASAETHDDSNRRVVG